MRIGLDTPANLGGIAANGGKTERATAKREQAASDEARLSTDRTGIRSLETELNSLPEIRLDKVDKLRRAIAGGNYRVNSEKIAEAMLKELTPLLNGDR